MPSEVGRVKVSVYTACDRLDPVFNRVEDFDLNTHTNTGYIVKGFTKDEKFVTFSMLQRP